MLENAHGDAQVSEAEESILPPDVIKRGYEKQLTLEVIRDRFREWLSSEHVKAQDALRDKKEEYRLAAPIVEAVRHLERAGDLVRSYEALRTEIETLEGRYIALDGCQLVAAGIYEVDFADEHTARFFAEFIAFDKPETWCLWQK